MRMGFQIRFQSNMEIPLPDPNPDELVLEELNADAPKPTEGVDEDPPNAEVPVDAPNAVLPG